MTPIDASKPNIARMYDYWLGGQDNYEADREAAEAVRRQHPAVADQALDNKRFQTRAVTFVAEQGVRQFLDIGSGLPTSPVRAESEEPSWLATHEAARAVIPDAMVAYVDYDPAAVAHSQALLATGSSQVVAVGGDMRDPEAILADPGIAAAGFSLADPACVILCCVLHFLDAGTAKGAVAKLARALAPGSYVIISVGFSKGRGGDEFARTYNAQDGPRIYSHSWEEITAMFDGLELVPPGLTNSAAWRAEGLPVAEQDSMILAGVGCRLGTAARPEPAGGARSC
jgi:O-methyltransferase involved in polyketide biosynthesis